MLHLKIQSDLQILKQKFLKHKNLNINYKFLIQLGNKNIKVLIYNILKVRIFE